MTKNAARRSPGAKRLGPGTRSAWRRWLAEHHDRSPGVWLEVFKKSAPAGSLRYEEAVEEALCFGWIDGQLKTLDASRFLIWLSPRKPGSLWAESNKRRIRKLTRQGLMTPAGLAKVAEAKRNGQWRAASERENTQVIPPAIVRGLARRKGALPRFRRLRPSHRKMLVYWITNAKRDETRQRRIEQVVSFLLDEDERFPWERASGRSKNRT